MKYWRPQIKMRRDAQGWLVMYICDDNRIILTPNVIIKPHYIKKKKELWFSRSRRKYCKAALVHLSGGVTECWVCFLRCGWKQRRLRCSWKTGLSLRTVKINSSQQHNKGYYKTYILLCVCAFGVERRHCVLSVTPSFTYLTKAAIVTWLYLLS